MQATVQEDGNLRIEASPEDMDELRGKTGYYEMESCVIQALQEDYEMVRPEAIGALTDAPIFASFDDIGHPDSGDFELRDGAPVWWYPSYAVLDPWEELARDGFVIFTRAEES